MLGYSAPWTKQGVLSLANPESATRRHFFRSHGAETTHFPKRPWTAIASFIALPDANLIRLCTKFDELEGRLQVMDGTFPRTAEGDAEFDGAYEMIRHEQEELLSQICALSAVTAEGALAKATTLIYFTSNMLTSSDSGWGARLTVSMRRDLTNAGRLPASPRRAADAPVQVVARH